MTNYYFHSLYKVIEHGIKRREHDQFYTKRPACQSSGQSFGSVRLTDCYAALLALCYGMLASFVILIIERTALKQCHFNEL